MDGHPFPRDNNDWWAWPIRSRILDQHFGMGLLNDPFFRYPASVFPYYMRPNVASGGLNQGRTGFAEVANEKDKFVVKMDVSHFKPDELKVMTADNCLVVEGNHEERKDEHGYVKRSFSRRYLLPKDVDVSTMKSSLGRDGVLTIEAPKMLAIEGSQEHPIAIESAPEGAPSLEAPPKPAQSPQAPSRK